MTSNPKITVIGLGYVGLPLAIAFGRKYNVVGFDLDSSRIEDLKEGKDITLEVSENELTKTLVSLEQGVLLVGSSKKVPDGFSEIKLST